MSDKPAPLMDVTAIQATLPHRYPFLLVDRVLSMESMKKLVAVKCVTINEPFFNGHFPGHPVMPGVLILEALAQAAGLLVKSSMTEDTSEKVTYLMAIDNARFRKPVVPGDRLELHVEVVKQKGPIWKTKGVAMVDGGVAAEADFMAMLVDRKKEG
ncbi:MAG: 3-hydroxyacyl-ACP dehydratase FabZ [Deltaproteobacteria bacterium]